MSPARILVVDDDSDIRRLVRTICRSSGHEAIEAVTGRAALRAMHAARPNLVVLDVAMPELDGWTTLERIRELSEVPVLMLTARTGELEKVRALKAGADDYVTKPFGRRELSARIEALLRRSGGEAEIADRYADDYLAIDFRRRSVTVGEREVSLTPLEFRLLAAFARHPNQVLSREQLLELVWNHRGALSGEVKQYVGYLRRKLGDDAPIETMRGFGYRYRTRPA